MFKTFANAWKIPELRKKILFTALIVLIFRVGSAIPVPFTNILIEGGNLVQEGSTFLNYLIMMTGDAFNYGTLFALSITPYINSSIIMQLLCVAIPPLERLAKEEDGQKKIASQGRGRRGQEEDRFHHKICYCCSRYHPERSILLLYQKRRIPFNGC